MKGRKGTQNWPPTNVYVGGKLAWAYLGRNSKGQPQYLCAVRGIRPAPDRREVSYWLAFNNNASLKRASQQVGDLALLLGRYVLNVTDKLRFVVNVCLASNPPQYGKTQIQCVQQVAKGLGLRLPANPIQVLTAWGKANGLL